MTPEKALTRYGALHAPTAATSTSRTVHVDETCQYLQRANTSKRIVTPGELPLRATLCEWCTPGDGQEAAADGGQR